MYVPTLRAAGEIDTERVDGAVPDAGETANHEVPGADVLTDAVQASLPLPPLAIWMDWAGGAVPPVV